MRRRLRTLVATLQLEIAKLRRKIEADPASPESIVTVRGAGYRLLLEAR